MFPVALILCSLADNVLWFQIAGGLSALGVKPAVLDVLVCPPVLLVGYCASR